MFTIVIPFFSFTYHFHFTINRSPLSSPLSEEIDRLRKENATLQKSLSQSSGHVDELTRRAESAEASLKESESTIKVLEQRVQSTSYIGYMCIESGYIE